MITVRGRATVARSITFGATRFCNENTKRRVNRLNLKYFYDLRWKNVNNSLIDYAELGGND